MSQATVESGKAEKVVKGKYPKAVGFILTNVFFERFCSGGIIAILALYLNQKLQFDSNASTALFHVNEFVLYFCSIIGAVVADSWLGLFKTLSWMALLFSLGAGTIAIVSIDILQLPIKLLSLIGLFAIVVASGGIKSNQNVFGGNQFKLPEQESQLNSFFSLQYFTLKCGLLAGQLLVPILRNDVSCFGSNDCYPLAFGLPAIFMLLSFLILLCGKSLYVHVPPTENMFVKVLACILNAIKQKFTNRQKIPKGHWLDYAEDKFGPKLVMETKMVLNVLTIFLCLPVFWALYGQINSRWVFQASKMNGDIGGYAIKPDQMVMSTSLFIIILIPFFERVVYPIIAKAGIKSPLQKMMCGFICSAIAFVIAAVIEWINKDTRIHMLWLIPQYFIIALAEVFLWVSVISFAYSQAPDSMKSVLTAFVYLTIAGGSSIVIVISGANLFESLFYEYIFYVILMIVNTIFFSILTKKYKFVGSK